MSMIGATKHFSRGKMVMLIFGPSWNESYVEISSGLNKL